MIALKVTTTMASPSISTLKQPTWVRTLSSSSSSSPSSSLTTNPATTFKHRRISPLMSTTPNSNSNSNSLINRKNGGGGGAVGGGERLLRLISCADFGWGGVHDNNNINNNNKTSIIPPKIKKSFSSSASAAAANNNPRITKNNMKDGGGDGGGGGDEESAPKLLTIPTILTLGRVAAIPLLITTFYSNSWWATTATTSIFIAAAITDWLDGYIARKMHLGTPFGAFLDPVADKLMVAATLVLLCTRPLEVGSFGEIPWLLPIPSIAIIGREITMSAVREWAASQNGKVLEAVAVNNLGKWKTASQMVSLTILLATRDTSILGSNILVPTGVSLLYISAGLAVWSLAVYMKKIWRVMLKL